MKELQIMTNIKSEFSDPNVEVALIEQGAEVIVKIKCDFIHLICVSVHWKHAASTVSDLQVNNATTKQ